MARVNMVGLVTLALAMGCSLDDAKLGADVDQSTETAAEETPESGSLTEPTANEDGDTGVAETSGSDAALPVHDAGAALDAGVDARVEPEAGRPEAGRPDASAADAAFLSVGTDHCLPTLAANRCGRAAPNAYACALEVSLLAPALDCLPPEDDPAADGGTWCCPVQYCARVRASTGCRDNLVEYLCPASLEIPAVCTERGPADGGARSLCCPDLPSPSRPMIWSGLPLDRRRRAAGGEPGRGLRRRGVVLGAVT